MRGQGWLRGCGEDTLERGMEDIGHIAEDSVPHQQPEESAPDAVFAVHALPALALIVLERNELASRDEHSEEAASRSRYLHGQWPAVQGGVHALASGALRDELTVDRDAGGRLQGARGEHGDLPAARRLGQLQHVILKGVSTERHSW